MTLDENSRRPFLSAAAAAGLLAVILCAGFALRLRAADHACITQWDEAYHALVAKNLAKHPLLPTLYDDPRLPHDDKHWERSNIWLHKPPVPLWLMALSMRIAGEEELVFRFPSVVLGTLSILLTFLLALELLGAEGLPCDRRRDDARLVGLLAAALHALNPLFIRLAAGAIPTDHIDVALAFFVELSFLLFLLCLRKPSALFPALAGAALGLGFLSKSWPSLTALAALLPLLRAQDRERARSLLFGSATAFLCAVLPWQAYCALRWPQAFLWESRFNSSLHFFTTLDGHAHPSWWYLRILAVQLGGVPFAAYALALGSLLYCGRRAYARKDPRLAAVIAWALLPYLVFSLSRTKLYSYIGVAMPALFLLCAMPADFLLSRLRADDCAQPAAPRARNAAAAAGLLYAAALCLHVASVLPQRLRADYGVCAGYSTYEQDSFRAAFKAFSKIPGRKVVFNVQDGKEIPAMFYGDCTAYPSVPKMEELRALLKDGRTVYYLAREDAPERVSIAKELKRAGLPDRVGIILLRGRPRAPQPNPYEN